MDTELDQEIKKLLPKLDRVINNALPDDMRKMFAYYTFLTLFDACRPHTELGIIEARKCIKKVKKQLNI